MLAPPDSTGDPDDADVTLARWLALPYAPPKKSVPLPTADPTKVPAGEGKPVGNEPCDAPASVKYSLSVPNGPLTCCAHRRALGVTLRVVCVGPVTRLSVPFAAVTIAPA